MRKTAPWSAALTLVAAVTGSAALLALTAAPAQAAPARAESLYAPSALVLTVTDGRISHVAAFFDTTLFGMFGLPASLPLVA